MKGLQLWSSLHSPCITQSVQQLICCDCPDDGGRKLVWNASRKSPVNLWWYPRRKVFVSNTMKIPGHIYQPLRTWISSKICLKMFTENIVCPFQRSGCLVDGVMPCFAKCINPVTNEPCYMLYVDMLWHGVLIFWPSEFHILESNGPALHFQQHAFICFAWTLFLCWHNTWKFITCREHS